MLKIWKSKLKLKFIVGIVQEFMIKLSNIKARYILFVSIFFLSRIIFFEFGIRFDYKPLFWLDQYLEVDLLRNKLLESLFYLHCQPPLFNAFLGVIVKLFSGCEQIIFAVIYMCFGLLIYIFMYEIMQKLGIKRIISFAISTIFIVSPAAILYENWLFYTYPMAFLITFSTLALMQLIEKNCLIYFILFFSLLAFMSLTRTVFHPLLVLGIAIILFLFFKKGRKNIILGSGLPLIIIFSVLIKNIIIFGVYSSSWFGMNFADITIKYIPNEKKHELVRQNKLGQLALIPPFGHLEEYTKFIKPHKPFGIICLDKDITSANKINFNNYDYIAISKLYMDESKKALLCAPEYYLKNGLASFYLYFRSPSDYKYFANPNNDKIKGYDRVYNLIAYGQTKIYSSLTDYEKISIKNNTGLLTKICYTGVLSLFLIPFLIIFSIYLLIKKRDALEWSTKAAIIYLNINILMVALLVNLVELGENNRFRFEIEPLLYILFGLLTMEIYNKIYENRKSTKHFKMDNSL